MCELRVRGTGVNAVTGLGISLPCHRQPPALIRDADDLQFRLCHVRTPGRSAEGSLPDKGWGTSRADGSQGPVYGHSRAVRPMFLWTMTGTRAVQIFRDGSPAYPF